LRPPIVFDEFFCFSLVIVAALGLCLGSFATALIYRIPRDIPWIRNKNGTPSRSQCPACHAMLTILDLIPFFSWLAGRGQCRHCKARISSVYPVTELACCLLTLALFIVWGPQWATIPVLLTVPFLVSILMIDWEHMIIPDDLNVALVILGLAYVVLPGGGNWQTHLIAGVLLPAIFWLAALGLKYWKKREAIGLGDIKFLAGAGLFIGLANIPAYLVASGVLGLVCALYGRLKGQNGAFPFGPALVISLILHLFLTGLGFDSRGIY